ncbi:Hint domain-containing protein [Roseovarius dicentrarchi]|uniref:Hint domain-containing protein n=1 Tax=Roseovarius dicentrarchi TaxID=2250573 RepID=UPI000DEB0C35|nr:Hint domain-containing protein [Roseovarius dicentrarchi]
MGWIGIGDHGGGILNAAGLAAGDAARGTLMVETVLSPACQPQIMLSVPRARRFGGVLSLQVLPSGAIALIDEAGGDVRHTLLPHELDSHTDLVRITYAWDSAARTGRLALENLASSSIQTVATPPPHPIAQGDLHRLICGAAGRIMDRDVSFVALSDRIEPIGPMPSLTAQVPVATPHGDVPVARLRRGDIVLTPDGDAVPILRCVRQTVPARGSLRPVRLRAPYFGLTRTIAVAPHQRLVIGGGDVEYMFAAEAALVAARHLVNGASAHYGSGPDMVTYYGLLLPDHQTLLAAGCPVESLYIGRLRRDKQALAASVLGHEDAARLPEHAPPVWPVLKPFEARALAIHRAA